jgi:hypothetical protein
MDSSFSGEFHHTAKYAGMDPLAGVCGAAPD